MTSEFKGPFADELQEYISFRIAIGYSKTTYITQARSFDDYSVNYYPNTETITEEMAVAWTIHNSPSASVTNARYTFIKLFGKYLVDTGRNAFILPDDFRPKVARNPTPYLFSETELTLFFHELDLFEKKDSPFVPIMLSVYFRLTYTCGLRPNESRLILRNNVNLANGEILIQNSKGKRDRYVIMSNAMHELMIRYCSIKDTVFPDTHYLFPNSAGKCYLSSFYQYYYRMFFAKIHPEIPETEFPQVRVYDLRHMFATTVIHNWIDSGENLANKLPLLQIYMGHSNVSETVYYLHLLPERLSASTAISWEDMNSVIPEVSDEE